MKRAKGNRSKKLCEKLNQGASLDVTAKSFGITKYWLKSKLQTLGFCFLPMPATKACIAKVNERGLAAEKAAERLKGMSDLLNQGASSAEIARQFGVSRERIRQLFIRSHLHYHPVKLEAERCTPERLAEKAQKNRDDARAWRIANPEKRRAQVKIYSLRRRERDPAFVLKNSLKNRYRMALTNVKSITGELLEHLGCSIEEARMHIENQFQPGMTWENHGLHGWHIDHIRPVASFDLYDIEDRRKCFHYSNLQPLWAADNIAKSDKWEAVAA